MFEIITDIARAINVYGYKSLAFAVGFVRVVDIYLSVNNVYTMQLQTIDHRFVLGSQRSEIWLGAMQLVEQNSSWPEMTDNILHITLNMA